MKIVITDSMKRHWLYKSYRRHLIAKVLGCCLVGPILLALYGALGVMGVLAIKSGFIILGIISLLGVLTFPIVISVFRSDFRDLRWRFKCAVGFARSHPGVQIESIYDEKISGPPLFD